MSYQLVGDYDSKTIEPKWQRFWEERQFFHAPKSSSQPKLYLLEMLPYPSGDLHMGHMRNYTIGDAVARYQRARGMNVFHPIGWDAFGLPAENAAIKNKTHPRTWTLDNIARMKAQLRRFGFSYDWSSEVSTCEPEYYRWNQWFFLQFFNRGLAYRKKSRVNWCPKCQTVLANEQVVEGCCWRHEETLVEQRELEQWFLKITDYAEQLLADLDKLAGRWPERILTMQRNWIGKSVGARVRWSLIKIDKYIETFTTRIDTIYGAVALLLAPEHPLVDELIAAVPGHAAIQRKVEKMRQQSHRAQALAEAEKEGIFTGRFALHPFTGEKVPIWVSNFVLMEYGTGAVQAVPAHDERDFEFCHMYRLPIPIVVQPLDDKPLTDVTLREAFTGYGRLVKSGPYTGLTSEQALEKMADDLAQQGRAEKRSSIESRIGASPASATGARRFPSFTARHAAPCRCRKTSCRWCCRSTSKSPAPASRRCSTCPRSSTPRARSAASRDGARPTPWTRSSIRPGISTAISRRTRTKHLLTSRSRGAFSPLTSTSAAPSTPCCT
jgi:leucyl-tRNA synthetase